MLFPAPFPAPVCRADFAIGASAAFDFETVIAAVCRLDWAGLSRDELIDAAWGYYYFSIQFRQNLDIACALYPKDERLQALRREECKTANLSPWPGVAGDDERLDHDEFLRRLLASAPPEPARRRRLEAAGARYLDRVRHSPPAARALSIASYEDGGLERVFRAILGARDWSGPVLQGFRHFLTAHIAFDSDAGQGHGALSRHLQPDDRVLPLWIAFRELLLDAVPRLAGAAQRC